MTEDTALPAATLILLRDGAAGPEIFLVERAKSMGFAGGALVFPGGKVDPSDVALAADPRLAPGFAALDPVDAAARVAAVRETFEEAGVLVTRGGPVDEALRADWRPRVTAHDAPFADLLRRIGHSLDPDLLLPFAHWCPPQGLHAKRFDTRFYLARMPGHETALHDGGESTTSHWLRAADAIARADAGQATIIFPTRRNLERLALHDGIEALVAATRAQPLRRVQPWVEDRDGQPTLVIPDDAGYPVTSEPLTSALRG
jgi:8-oxo-dGTP pyrophosphatase MutT (NUDIX family)